MTYDKFEMKWNYTNLAYCLLVNGLFDKACVNVKFLWILMAHFPLKP